MRIYCDFEYNDNRVVLGCFLIVTFTGDIEHRERVEIDCRQPGAGALLQRLKDDHPDAVWCAYAATAEMTSFRRMGVPLDGMAWVDLMAEASMVSGTHPAFLLRRPSLLDHLDTFAIRAKSPEEEAHKDAMRDLILSDREFTADEWANIVRYCWTDVEPLPLLYRVLHAVHSDAKTLFSEADAIERGEYLKASVEVDYRGRGLPIDTGLLALFDRHKDAVIDTLAIECNEHYGEAIYVYNHVAQRYSFSAAGLERYLTSLERPIVWERTESGRLRLDEDYLSDLAKLYPQLAHLKSCRVTMQQIRKNELSSLLDEEGFIRPVSLPFYTVTGRNQPLVKRGFVLNMPPWIRHIVRPKPGYVLIAADWSKQEIAIALAFSKDENLRSAYQSGDIYLTLAKMAGAVPDEGTKKTHGLERQAYKAVQLGLGYGMGKISLGRNLYNDLNDGADTLLITHDGADAKAEEIYAWHKRTFRDYWSYLDSAARGAMRGGWAKSLDNWYYFATPDTKFTRIMNFPIQSNGAVCLREAVKRVARETDLNVVCSLHDALYIYCREEDATRATAELTRCMRAAAETVVGADVKIDIDTKVYTHDDGYEDERGTKTFHAILERIAHIEKFGAPPPPEKPIRKKKTKPPRLDAEYFGVAA